MTADSQPVDVLKTLFKAHTCLTIDDLAQQMDYAVISVRRFLKDVGYFRSYSHNGRFYTLRSIPRFNKNGIWLWQDVGFSRYGSLTQTLSHHIAKAPQGYSAAALADIVHISCHSVLTNMYKAGQIDRVQFDRRFVYLSADVSINRRQRKMLELVHLGDKAPGVLSNEAAVCVLVEFIKHPTFTFSRLAERVTTKKNIPVSAEQIARFFAQHGLKKNRFRRS